MARVSRSASYNGWYPYQDRIADICDALGSQEARNAAGLRREILPRTSTAVGGANRLIRRRGNRVEQGRFGMNDTHAAATAAAGRFDDDGIANTAGGADNFLWVIGQGTV